MNPVHPWLDADQVKRLAELLMRPPPAPEACFRHDAGFGNQFVGFAIEELRVSLYGEGPAPVDDAPPPAAVTPDISVVPVAMSVGWVGPASTAIVPDSGVEPPPHEAAPEPAPPAEVEPEPIRNKEVQAAAAEVASYPFVAVSEPDMKPVADEVEVSGESSFSPVDQEVEDQDLPSPSRASFLERIRQYRDWLHQRFSATGLFILDRDGKVIFDEGPNTRLHFLARSLALASRRPGSVATNVHVKIGVGATFEVIPVDTPFGCLVMGAVLPDSLGQEAVEAIRQALLQTVRHPDNATAGDALNEPAQPARPVESPAGPGHPPE